MRVGLTTGVRATPGEPALCPFESYASFWASAFKEVIVFTLIIPVLIWRSFITHHVEEDE